MNFLNEFTPYENRDPFIKTKVPVIIILFRYFTGPSADGPGPEISGLLILLS